MSDILISYAREDRPAATTLAATLALYGYNVWWDRELLSGVDFEQEISLQLATARVVIVIWSEHSVTSNWVRDEANAAASRDVLIPVLLGNPTIPFGFRSIHSIPLDEHNLTELLRAINHRTGIPVRPPLPPSATPSATTPRSPFPWLETGIGFVLLAALSALLYRIYLSG